MTEVILDIKKWGNSLGVRLPAVIAREVNLKTDQSVKMTVQDKQIIIKSVSDKPLTLKQRLENFDPARHGGEAIIVGERLGAEKW